MGVVYEAEQLSLQRRVALKVLPRQALVDRTALQRFRDEARLAASLHHTHIVPIFGYGEQKGVHFFAMQLIKGTTLFESLPGSAPDASKIDADDESAAAPRWPPQEVARLGCRLADAVQFAHARGVLHRDITPNNVLIGETGDVWIADFGLASMIQHAQEQPMTAVGTPRYMAPETAQGRYDERSDLYSLGMTLKAILSPPKESDDLPDSAASRVPADLAAILDKATATAPEDRYATAADFGTDLARFLNQLPVSARPLSPLGRAVKWTRRRPALAAACSAIVLLLAATLGIQAMNNSRMRVANAELEDVNTELTVANESLTVSNRRLVKSFFTTDAMLYGLVAATRQTLTGSGEIDGTISADGIRDLDWLVRTSDIVPEAAQDPARLYRAAGTRLRVAQVLASLGKYDEAEAVIAYGLRLLDHLDRMPQSDTAMRDQVFVRRYVLFNDLGGLLQRQAERSRAEQAYQAALAAVHDRREAGPLSTEMQVRTSLIEGEAHLGLAQCVGAPSSDQVPTQSGPYHPALEHCRQGIRLLKNQLADVPPSFDDNLLVSLRRLLPRLLREQARHQPADASASQHDLERSRDLLLDLQSDLLRDPNLDKHLHHVQYALAGCLHDLAVHPETPLAEAQRQFAHSAALLEQLRDAAPENVDYLRAHAQSFFDQGRAHFTAQAFQEAADCFSTALSMQNALCHRLPNHASSEDERIQIQSHLAKAQEALRQDAR